MNFTENMTIIGDGHVVCELDSTRHVISHVVWYCDGSSRIWG